VNFAAVPEPHSGRAMPSLSEAPATAQDEPNRQRIPLSGTETLVSTKPATSQHVILALRTERAGLGLLQLFGMGGIQAISVKTDG
jgi:hypothetical protein